MRDVCFEVLSILNDSYVIRWYNLLYKNYIKEDLIKCSAINHKDYKKICMK